MNVLVLGAGRVGSAITRDLHALPDLTVTVSDISEQSLARLQQQGIKTQCIDTTNRQALTEAVQQHDLIVTAVPGALGFETLRTVLEAGRNVVDISFFPEDAFLLEDVAKQHGVFAVVDAGVAPGLSNMMLGYARTLLDETQSFLCMVGGIPVERKAPWEYSAPFSPADVVEEYIRPVHIRRDGKPVDCDALDELETVELAGVGKLEAFLTDGLRTLLHTMDVPTMAEKTLRYPGYVEKIKLLRDSGFFSTETVAGVRPLDITTKLLERAWQARPDEPELTVMRVEVAGRKDGKRVRQVFDLLDHYDAATHTSSMARTTGYTCTALVRWVAMHGAPMTGIVAPEIMGALPGCFDFVRAHHAERGVHVTRFLFTDE